MTWPGSKTLLLASLLASSCAFASDYFVAPHGDDGADGRSSPWRTIQHAVDSVPEGERVIVLWPGTYVEGTCLDFSRRKSGNLTIQSKDPSNPAVITASGDRMVAKVSGGGGSLRFRDVSIVHPAAASLMRVEAKDILLAFERCSLVGGSCLVETTAQATGARIDFQQSKIRAKTKALVVPAAAAVSLQECALEWEDGPLLQGRPRDLLIERCSLQGSPTTLVLQAGAGAPMDRVEFARCTGSCGRLLWEQVGIRQLIVTGNAIRWKHTGTVTIGAGIELRNNQTTPVVNPAPFEKILIADNTFHFAEDTTHTIFLGKGADRAEVVRNILIAPKSRKYGIVLKSDHTHFEYNRILGGNYTFYLAGGQHNQIRHNTIFSEQRSAFVIDANQERTVPPAGAHGQPKNNIVEDNVFVATQSIAFGQDVAGDDDSASWNNAVDRNVYWVTGPGVLAVLNQTSIPRDSGIAALREEWRKYGGAMKGNDANSLVADPLLANPPDDLSLQPSSPARQVDAVSGRNAGAWREIGADAPPATGKTWGP